MFKKLAYAAAAGVIALVPFQTAKATTACTSGSFNFCFDFTFSNNSFSVTFNPTGSGATSTGALTDFGLWGYSSISGPFSYLFNGGQGWAAATTSNGNCPGLGNGNDVGVPLPFQACVTPNPGSAGLLNNQTLTLGFTGNATVSSGAEIHIQNVNGTDCSLHVNLLTMATGGTTGNCGGTTTAPEPASMALVATGLLGLGGVAIRRRRRS